MPDRRSFLKGIIAASLVPPIYEEIARGKSFISLYSPKIIKLTESEIVAIELEKVRQKLPKLFDCYDPFYESMNVTKSQVYTQEMRIPLEFNNENS